MIFSEPRFIAFFAVAFAIHWTLRGSRPRKLWLLACSYAFYAAWDFRFLSLIAFSTLVDYGVGLGLARPGAGDAQRSRLLTLSVATNLGLLGIFKYLDFFLDSAGRFSHWLGLPVSAESLGIVLPVGISFYTFQSLSYSIDVHRGRLAARRSLLDFALFVGFFPQLVAGPIVRASHFLPQLDSPARLADVRIKTCLVLFLLGFVKKACISDSIAPTVDAYFAQPELYSAFASWVAVVLYASQIYCDFSGYSDMAIASAGLLGFDLCRNFDAPYTASHIADFWRRWHISLSTWLRDYLYIALGGNRGSRLFLYRNLLLTMLLGGLWHGAAWHFVLWGALHGLALIVHRVWRERRPAQTATALGTLLGTAATLWWVCLCWIFFRAASLADAALVVRSFVLFESPGARSLEPLYLAFAAALLLVHALPRLRARSGADVEAIPSWEGMPDWLFAPAYGACVALAVSGIQTATQPFIYFQF